ncbi:MAG: glycosyltransferase family 2 protein, partial [Rhodocyclaceae bacterium]|nr:glycosyltransferase family 2 protein [Rhodocyclaceae bacterium]
MIDLYHLLRAVPRAVAFYHGSPTLAARRAFRVLRREGIGGIRRRVFILLGGLGSASAGATELYGDFPKANEEFQPKVSVIVPNYNHAPYLRQRLDSIYQQTYQNMEVILLDDCSSDASVEILMEYAQRFPDRTICRFNDANSGSVFQQWKKGLEVASGELVWIAESDDFCAENFLAEQVRAFQNSAVRLSFCKTKFVAGEPAEEAWTLDYHLSDLNLADFSRSFVRSAHSLVRDGWAVKNI